MAIMDAGRRDRRIVFQRATEARGGLGVKTPTGWTDLGAPNPGRLARVLYGTGAERRQAAAEGAIQTATFRVLADNLTRTVTVRDRIAHAGLAWDVTAIAPIGTDEIEFTGTASRG